MVLSARHVVRFAVGVLFELYVTQKDRGTLFEML